MKPFIATSADERYATLLMGLLDSLAPHRSALNFEVGCIDLGLAPESVDRATRAGATVKSVDWPFKPHPTFSADRKFLSRAVRPFIPDIFPGHDTYIWLDADTWVQQVQGLNWLAAAAQYSDIAAAPTLHRCYALQPRDVQWLYRRYAMAFGAETARQLMRQPYINSGVTSISSSSKIWPHYRRRFQEALDRWEGEFLSDQAVINAVVQLDQMRFEKLPAQVNWIAHLAYPAWDPKRSLLVVPSMPFEPIAILHNTFNEKSKLHKIASLKGTFETTGLSYPAITALAARM